MPRELERRPDRRADRTGNSTDRGLFREGCRSWSSPEVEGSLHSVTTALDALECLEATPEMGVSELSRALGVAKSTAYRVLSTLCAKGLVERSPDSQKYRLGQRLHELGEVAASRSRLRECSLPLLEELRNRTGETVHVAIPHGSEVFYVERLESYHGLRFSARVGRRMPVYCTSSGKAIAAFNSEVAMAAFKGGFAPLTGRTIRSTAQLLACLKETRERGFALSIEEAEVGLSSVAAPVLDKKGVARAAISVAGPAGRIPERGITHLAGVVVEAAKRLAAMEERWWSGALYR